MENKYKAIIPEISQYLGALDEIEAAIEQRREYLQKRVGQGNISEGQLHYENKLLGTIAQYIERTEALLQTGGRIHEALEIRQQQARLSQFQSYELRLENKKLRKWLESLGRNPEAELKYIQV